MNYFQAFLRCATRLFHGHLLTCSLVSRIWHPGYKHTGCAHSVRPSCWWRFWYREHWNGIWSCWRYVVVGFFAFRLECFLARLLPSNSRCSFVSIMFTSHPDVCSINCLGFGSNTPQTNPPSAFGGTANKSLFSNPSATSSPFGAPAASGFGTGGGFGSGTGFGSAATPSTGVGSNLLGGTQQNQSSGFGSAAPAAGSSIFGGGTGANTGTGFGGGSAFGAGAAGAGNALSGNPPLTSNVPFQPTVLKDASGKPESVEYMNICFMDPFSKYDPDVRYALFLFHASLSFFY